MKRRAIFILLGLFVLVLLAFVLVPREPTLTVNFLRYEHGYTVVAITNHSKYRVMCSLDVEGLARDHYTNYPPLAGFQPYDGREVWLGSPLPSDIAFVYGHESPTPFDKLCSFLYARTGLLLDKPKPVFLQLPIMPKPIVKGAN